MLSPFLDSTVLRAPCSSGWWWARRPLLRKAIRNSNGGREWLSSASIGLCLVTGSMRKCNVCSSTRLQSWYYPSIKNYLLILPKSPPQNGGFLQIYRLFASAAFGVDYSSTQYPSRLLSKGGNFRQGLSLPNFFLHQYYCLLTCTTSYQQTTPS